MHKFGKNFSSKVKISQEFQPLWMPFQISKAAYIGLEYKASKRFWEIVCFFTHGRLLLGCYVEFPGKMCMKSLILLCILSP